MGLFGLPDDLESLFAEAYQAGARVHTNSWGGPAKDNNGNNIADIFKELSDAMYHIERNGNAKIILTDLSIKLTRLIHKK